MEAGRPLGSRAGKATWPTRIMSTSLLTADSKGGRSVARHLASDSWITAGSFSVFSVVEPSPGKCLAVVATPPWWYPHTWAVTRRDTTVGVEPNDRPSIGTPT